MTFKERLSARTHWANFCLFCEKICHQFLETSAPGDFYIYQILSRLTKFQRRRRPASEQDVIKTGNGERGTGNGERK